MPPTQPEKPFDEWNQHKKSIQGSNAFFPPFYYVREVWRCSVGVNVGVEADGKHEYFERPILVITKFNKDMFWGVPLTSHEKSGRFFHRVAHDTGISWAILSQLRIFSSRRLIRKMGTVSDGDFSNICDKLTDFILKSKPLQQRRGISEAEAHNESIIAGGGSPSS
ncbi:MAG: type II toxin-antitoxin system PemK/MazF family toxin [Patescibacteria group bacterium]